MQTAMSTLEATLGRGTFFLDGRTRDQCKVTVDMQTLTTADHRRQRRGRRPMDQLRPERSPTLGGKPIEDGPPITDEGLWEVPTLTASNGDSGHRGVRHFRGTHTGRSSTIEQVLRSWSKVAAPL